VNGALRSTTTPAGGAVGVGVGAVVGVAVGESVGVESGVGDALGVVAGVSEGAGAVGDGRTSPPQADRIAAEKTPTMDRARMVASLS
jgi:hypothetical protein